MTDATRAGIVKIGRGWIGTPYVTGAALRGVGCDCVGLLRGVMAELTGAPLEPVPPWRADWSAARGAPLIAAARAHLREIPRAEAQPGDAVIFRCGFARAAHCGVLMPAGRILHAAESVGVVEVSAAGWAERIIFAGAFSGAGD